MNDLELWYAKYKNNVSDDTKFYLFLTTDVVSPGTADSSGDYFALHHDSGAWTIKEYGTKENAYSLCQFISKRS